MDENQALETMQQGMGENPETAQEEAKSDVEMFNILNGEEEISLPANAKFRLKHNGAENEFELNNIINRFRQAEHLENKQRQYKERLEAWEKEKKEFGELDKYKQLQDWSVQNPEEADALWEIFQNRDKFLNTDEPQNALIQSQKEEIKALKDSVNELKEFYDSYHNEQAVEETKRDIEAFKEKYPFIKLDEQDMDGISLRDRIINFGIERGLENFHEAASLFKFDDGTALIDKLQETAIEKGRNETVNAIKADKKRGIVNRSSTPILGQGGPFRLRKSEEQKKSELVEKFKQMTGQ